MDFERITFTPFSERDAAPTHLQLNGASVRGFTYGIITLSRKNGLALKIPVSIDVEISGLDMIEGPDAVIFLNLSNSVAYTL